MNKNFLSAITVEPTNMCSLKCPGCPHGHGFFNGKPQGMMKLEDFKKIVDFNKKYIENIRFIGIGEPFLNKSLLDMMEYCSDNNIGVSAHTNGMLVGDKVIEKFKKIKTVFKLTFSLDGASSGTYSIYRVGGEFEKILKNVIALLKFKKDNNLKNIKVIWQFLLMEGNKHELEMAQRIAKKIKVDKFVVKDIILTGKMNNPQYFPVKKIKTKQDGRKKKKNNCGFKCEYIDPGSVFVLWDGTVVPCCIDYKRKNIMGNAFSDSLIEIWGKDKYKIFREKYNQNKNEACDHCRVQY